MDMSASMKANEMSAKEEERIGMHGREKEFERLIGNVYI